MLAAFYSAASESKKKIENERASHKDLVRDNNHRQLEGKHTRARIIIFLKSNFNLRN